MTRRAESLESLFEGDENILSQLRPPLVRRYSAASMSVEHMEHDVCCAHDATLDLNAALDTDKHRTITSLFQSSIFDPPLEEASLAEDSLGPASLHEGSLPLVEDSLAELNEDSYEAKPRQT